MDMFMSLRPKSKADLRTSTATRPSPARRPIQLIHSATRGSSPVASWLRSCQTRKASAVTSAARPHDGRTRVGPIRTVL